MLIAEQIKDSLWIGGQWESHPRKPLRRNLCREAQIRDASHYCIYPPQPQRPTWLVAYWRFRADGSGPRQLVSAAEKVANEMRENEYWLFDFDGRHWALMVDAKGVLATRSDIVISSAHLEDFESGLKGEWLANKRILSKSDYEEMLASDDRKPVKLLSANASLDKKKCVIVIGAAVALVGAGKLVKDFIDQRIAESALAEMEAKRLRQKLDLENILMPPPRAWLQACMTTASKNSYFFKGWVLSKWVCQRSIVTMTWSRSGGSVAERPDGILDLKGDEVRQVKNLHVAKKNARRVRGNDGLERFYAVLQPFQIESNIVKSLGSLKPGERGAGYSIKMKWTIGDPLAVNWDAIPGLYFTEVNYETGLNPLKQDGASRLKAPSFTLYGVLDRVGTRL